MTSLYVLSLTHITMSLNQHILFHSDYTWYDDAHIIDEDRMPVFTLEQKIQFQLQDGKYYEILYNTETEHVFLRFGDGGPYTAYEFTDSNISLGEILECMGYDGEPSVALQWLEENRIDDLSFFMDCVLRVPVKSLPVCQLGIIVV